MTGSGRCGTKYTSRVLSAAGVRCGHEQVFTYDSAIGRAPVDWGVFEAESSWMACADLPDDVPVVLLVRHPLRVVKSWVEIGMFTHQPANPCHNVSRQMCPWIYDEPSAADSALGLWLHCTLTALERAEMVVRLERFDEAQFARLLSWSGHDPSVAGWAMAQAHAGQDARNEHLALKVASGVRWEPDWSALRPELAEQAMDLAQLIGYDPKVVP